MFIDSIYKRIVLSLFNFTILLIDKNPTKPQTPIENPLFVLFNTRPFTKLFELNFSLKSLNNYYLFEFFYKIQNLLISHCKVFQNFLSLK